MIDRIGKYEIQAEIGEGAFGRVYRAYDPTVNRPVAIKVLTAEGKDLITRFRTEASAAGNLRHKNIVTIYEFGEHKGRPFIAMELLEGKDLTEVIAEQQTLTLLEKMHIMSQVAEGLHCAHSNRVLHRDIKPANIKLLPDGSVKILDFGIARVTRDRDSTRLTQKGDILGTILYMAPEQFSGAEVDRLCDIFAYGAIYYELLSGSHPFASSDPRSVMFKVTFEEPAPLRSINPAIPELLDQIVLRALQKDRELRYQSLRDLLIDSKPLLLELERERATCLLAEAKDLFARGDLEAAEAKAVEVIDLDLGIREAHEIREVAQKELQHRIVQPRIEALLRAAEQDMASNRFAEAVLNFEAALRLDRSNASIRDSLENARSLLERGRNVARLVLEARVALERGEPAAAAEKAAAALELDPEHADGQRLRAKADKQVEALQQQQIRESVLRAAGDLIASEQPDAAIEALQSIADDAPVAALLERARSLKAELARRKRRAEGIAAIQALLDAGRFREATESCALLQAEFPGDAEIRAQAEACAAATRAQALADASRHAHDLQQRGEFDAAEQVLQSALREYPGDSEVSALLETVLAARETHRRETAIATALDTASRDRAARRFRAALATLDEALRLWPRETRLSALRAEVQTDADAQRRAEETAEICRSASAAIVSGRYADVVRQLRDAVERYPEHRQIRELLALAETEENRRLRIEKAAGEARRLLDAAEFDRAAERIEAALGADPGAADLEHLLAEAWVGQEGRRAAEIDRQIVNCAAVRERGSLDEALAAAEEALAAYPGEQRLVGLRDELQTQVEAARARKEADDLAIKARMAERAGDPSAALDLWNRVLVVCPDFSGADAEADRVRRSIEELRRARLREHIEAALEWGGWNARPAC